MSLYEMLFIAQHVSNVITFILRSRRMYIGILFRCGVYWCIGAVRLDWGCIRMQVGAWTAPTCIRIPPYSSRTAPIHQYTPKQNNTPTCSRQLLRMNVITFEKCWAIKTFIKWHQVGSIYSTADNLTNFMCRLSSGSLNFLEPCGPVLACTVTALPLPLTLPCHQSHACYVLRWSNLYRVNRLNNI